MYGVELQSNVRMAVLRDGLSRREAARRFGLDRGTVSKMVGHAVPPGCRQAGARVRPKLDAHAGFIDEILKSDLTEQKKRRHTILRLFERLLDERGFDGGQTTVRDHVRPRRLSLEEGFVPPAHPPGHAQADFGKAWAVLGGVRRKVHVLVVDPPWSDAIFPKTHLAETAEERRTPAARERSDRAAPRLPRILRGMRRRTSARRGLCWAAFDARCTCRWSTCPGATRSS